MAVSGHASAKALIYLRFRGENPCWPGNARCKSAASRSMTFVPQPFIMPAGLHRNFFSTLSYALFVCVGRSTFIPTGRTTRSASCNPVEFDDFGIIITLCHPVGADGRAKNVKRPRNQPHPFPAFNFYWHHACYGWRVELKIVFRSLRPQKRTLPILRL